MDCIPVLLDHCNIDDYNPCIFLSEMINDCLDHLINAQNNHPEYQSYV
jgi:hypothetical protein